MDINPTALIIVAFFTAVAALSGAWLVGLTVGLGTIFVAEFVMNVRDDRPIVLLGAVALLIALLV